MTTNAPTTAGTDGHDGLGATPRGTGRHPAPVQADDHRFVPLAAEVGAVGSIHAEEHDRDASFVTQAYAAMRANGYLRLAVPADLGGLGASIRQICYAQAELAKHDGSTSLAATMHLYNTLVQVFRRQRGAADAEGVLRRIAAEDLIVATSGGSDWLWPSTLAVADEAGEGYRISGRKSFCSQSPEASVVTTCAVLVDGDGVPGPGSEVLHFALPLTAPGLRIEETWDALGMRGTASHDLVLQDVLVLSERIVARRPWGEFGVPLLAAAVHFAPVASATYFGIAAGARDRAVDSVSGASRGTTPSTELARVQRQVGLMDAKLHVAWWALLGSVDLLADDYAVDPETLALTMIAKREVVTAAKEVVDLAMEVAGGRSYARRSPLERAYRDVRAGPFHPLTPETTLTYTGRLSLGGEGTTE